jgi:isopropylmalate/homocitrate/citramalate synthase
MATRDEASAVRIVEVAPRDGLQNHARAVSTEAKIAFIDALSHAGLRAIETTSFVNPKAVPLLADAVEVMNGIERVDGVRFLALVPNEKGLDRALACAVDSIAVFASASETFSQRNINCSIEESLDRFTPVLARARHDGLWIRGYISMAFCCPFEGDIDPLTTARLAQWFLDSGCDEVCLADTIGTATVDRLSATLEATLPLVPAQSLALHLHDTYDRAIDNVEVGYAAGIRTFDSAAGGLGGCPFAPGATGNLATERLVEYLDSKAIPHGVDIEAVRTATAALLASAAA